MPYYDVLAAVAADTMRRLAWSSTNQGGFTGTGDLLGPVTGVGTAELSVGGIPGTVGVDFLGAAGVFASASQACLWREAENIRQDVIAPGTDTIDGMTCWPIIVETGAGVLIS
jgi:hypothetical protein